MTDAEAARLREDYLARLDDAMGALPYGVAGDLRAGIAEELTGIDADAVSARIAQLGDPAAIARAAADAGGDDAGPGGPAAPVADSVQTPAPTVPFAASGSGRSAADAPGAASAPVSGSASASATVARVSTIAPASAAAVPQPSVTSSRGFAIAAALVLGFGGFVVPAVGWVVGIALVLLSTVWRRGEKLVAIIGPFVVIALSALLSFVLSRVMGDDAGSDPVNPLVPTFGVHHVLFLVAFLLIPASGLWLLWRMRRR
ncbi:hypothetical protein [Microbacterium sp.]|uniref:hypothetical protein n=1 Tax=Microbacterium sp. TaxID=51671 RepID=UPI0039E3622C